jgi:hypothetical protein
MLAHDRAFERHELDPNCWTPRVLLQAAEQKSGPAKLEQIWTNMLNNDYAGGPRVGNTSVDAISQMGWTKGGQYLTRLSVLEATQALEGRSAVDPNVIGGNSYYAMYFEADRKWASVSAGGGHMSMREITDPPASPNSTTRARFVWSGRKSVPSSTRTTRIGPSPAARLPQPWTTCRIPRRHRPVWPTLVLATVSTH